MRSQPPGSGRQGRRHCRDRHRTSPRRRPPLRRRADIVVTALNQVDTTALPKRRLVTKYRCGSGHQAAARRWRHGRRLRSV